MHRPALAILMLAALTACATEPDPAERARLEIIGPHCDGPGVDAIAVHVDKPGIAVIRWSNKNACGDPA